MSETINQVSPPAALPVQPVAPERRTDLRQEAKDPGPTTSRAVEAVEKALLYSYRDRKKRREKHSNFAERFSAFEGIAPRRISERPCSLM